MRVLDFHVKLFRNNNNTYFDLLLQRMNLTRAFCLSGAKTGSGYCQ